VLWRMLSGPARDRRLGGVHRESEEPLGPPRTPGTTPGRFKQFSAPRQGKGLAMRRPVEHMRRRIGTQ
jgi:hypothetical protein